MKPKVLIGIETAMSGGAESFAIRLANALSKSYEVTLFVVQGNLVDRRLLDRQNNYFTLEKFTPPFEFLVGILDRVLFKLKIDISFRNALAIRNLKRIIHREHFNVLHSNQFKVDYLFYTANKGFGIPHVTTIHGDYLNFHKKLQLGGLRILNFEKKAKSVLSAISRIAYISDHQFRFLKETLALDNLEKCRKIYNGIDLSEAVLKKESLNNVAFTFGLVARGIPEKGWEISIQSFLNLNFPGAQLILVGESPYLDELRKKYTDARIIFAGYSGKPEEWIEKFDVGLLPTTFPSESLPTSIIEYLAMGKPVIATHVGEIKNMLIQDGRSAGILLELSDGKVVESQLTEAMRLLATNDSVYKSLKAETLPHSKTFDIHLCAQLYSNLYDLK